MPPTRTSTKLGRPAQPKQTSRKGKKAWRKNVDISSTEAHLDAMRDEAALPQFDKDGSAQAGKPLHTLPNDSLFVEDRSGQETALARREREKEPLKSLEILNRTSGAAPFNARARADFKLQQSTEGKTRSAGMSKKQKDKLRRLAGRGDQVRGPMGAQVEGGMSHVGREQSGAVKHAQGNLFDIWGQEDVKGKGKQVDSDDEDWVEIAVKKTIKPPSTFFHDQIGSTARSIPSVSLPHPGMSYNPDSESHESLIQQVYLMEKKLEDSDQMDDAEKKMWISKIADAREREAKLAELEHVKRYKGMDLDLPNEEDVQQEESISSDEEDGDKPKAQKKKTKQQRARAKRHAEELAKAQARRQAKAQAQLLPQLARLRKQQEAIARARLAAAEQRRLAKEQRIAARGLSGQKFGKHRVLPEKLDVQTGQELSESLRALKPEGNLFRDRYQKMQARALVEPRVPVTKTKRKYDKKTYETHAYKRFV